uniref:Large ribosomal subunit protein bL32m n=1 Tax=Cannabis sativa TaxID=3483 RepID=A0A803R2L5_CANSA
MAFRMLMLRSAGGKISSLLGLRWSHGAAIPGPLDGLIDRNVISPQMVLPEASLEDSYNNKNIGFGFPIFSFGGSMELMAVPKRKTSPHKRGIRNGPKALKPTPVIVRCRVVVESNCQTSIVAAGTEATMQVTKMSLQDERILYYTSKTSREL